MGDAYLKCSKCGEVYLMRDHVVYDEKARECKAKCPKCSSEEFTLDRWVMS